MSLFVDRIHRALHLFGQASVTYHLLFLQDMEEGTFSSVSEYSLICLKLSQLFQIARNSSGFGYFSYTGGENFLI